MLLAQPWIDSDLTAVVPRPALATAVNRPHDLTAAELEQWLGVPRRAVPTWQDLASALGPSIDVVAGAVSAPLARRLRFTLAVLRDVFPDDVGVRVWLFTPHPGHGDERPLDLLHSGRIDLLEGLAVGEWNRLVAARTTTTL